ncbi:hypothetical protein UlMin_031602 [Ulmus minor]
MTGSGSPCGACKFLRRKCVRGCVFAPYFCHEQGASHFAAIHKVFGASNVSKLLAHLPVSDRSGAALTISYEAQARLKDPIYGCVSQIFALQQQVINLQSQLASIKEQAAQSFVNGSACANPNNERYNNGRHSSHQEDVHNWFQSQNSNMVMPDLSQINLTNNDSSMMNFYEKKPINSGSVGTCENSSYLPEENGRFEEGYHYMSSLDSQPVMNKQMGIQDFDDFDDFQSMPFSYTHQYS